MHEGLNIFVHKLDPAVSGNVFKKIHRVRKKVRHLASRKGEWLNDLRVEVGHSLSLISNQLIEPVGGCRLDEVAT